MVCVMLVEVRLTLPVPSTFMIAMSRRAGRLLLVGDALTVGREGGEASGAAMSRGQIDRVAAIGVGHEDVDVGAGVAAEGNPAAVRREGRVAVVCGPSQKLGLAAAVVAHRVDVLDRAAPDRDAEDDASVSATAEPDFEATGWSALATIGSPVSRSRCCCRSSSTCSRSPCAASCRRTGRRPGRAPGPPSWPGCTGGVSVRAAAGRLRLRLRLAPWPRRSRGRSTAVAVAARPLPWPFAVRRWCRRSAAPAGPPSGRGPRRS